MICDLHLEKFLFIQNAQLEFASGLNVITGETGAGKSILLEAVKLLLGKKARSGLVLPGSTQAKIQARFDLAKVPAARAYLAESGFSNDDHPSELIISRTFKSEGAEKVFINGIMSTTNVLKGLGVYLMEIHGQNEHQTLLDPKTQRKLLDRTGGEPFQKKLSEFGDLYQKRKLLMRDLEDLEKRLSEKDSRLEELYEIRQALETLGLEGPGEEERLKEEANRISHFEQIGEALSTCQTSLSGDDQTDGIITLLHRARESVKNAIEHDPQLQEISDRLESTYQETADLEKEVSRRASHLDFNPEHLAQLQSRLADISRACRRYKTDCEGLYKMTQDIQAEIGELTSPDSSIEKRRAELKKINDQFERSVKDLSTERKKLALKLEKAVSNEMKHLGFAAAGFSAAMNPIEPGADGGESIEFMVSLNPGAPGGPLRKIASGGELSRVALALKSFLAKGDDMPSMVFDEIDTGIGGETGKAVAKTLGGLAKAKQVLLVTHLHQIAKEGSSHFTVTKKVADEKTIVMIEAVQGKAREKEIARMLGATGSEGLSFARSILKEKDQN